MDYGFYYYDKDFRDFDFLLHGLSISLFMNVIIATYLSAGGRRKAHGCVFQGWKARGVATNVYSRKTSKKPERVVYEL